MGHVNEILFVHDARFPVSHHIIECALKTANGWRKINIMGHFGVHFVPPYEK